MILISHFMSKVDKLFRTSVEETFEDIKINQLWNIVSTEKDIIIL